MRSLPPARPSPNFHVVAVPACTLALLLMSCATPGPVIAFQDSESAMELELVGALEAAGLHADLETFGKDPNDKFIRLGFADEGVPPYALFVDTQPASKNRDERAVRVDLRPWVYTTKEGLPATLVVLNEANAEYWPGDLFVAPDQDIRGEWVVNTRSGAPISAWMVVDMVQRMASLWLDTYPKLQACAACQIHTKDAEEQSPKRDGPDHGPTTL